MVITSLLDTDLYKFTMMQAVLHQFPGAQVSYKFKCRTPGVKLAPYVDDIRAEIRSLCKLQFTEQELDWMRALRFIKSDFVDFLGLFRLNEKYIDVVALPNGVGIGKRHTNPSGDLRWILDDGVEFASDVLGRCFDFAQKFIDPGP